MFIITGDKRMNNALSKTQTVLVKIFGNQADQSQSRTASVSLRRMGMLYVVAAIFQTSWLYFVISNEATAKQWVSFPLIGWSFIGIWTMMVWCIPHLFLLGLRMTQLGSNPTITIIQTEYEKKRQFQIALLLVLGIVLDIAMFPLMLNMEDKGAVVFMTALMGGRVMQVNLEAIFQYHNH